MLDRPTCADEHERRTYRLAIAGLEGPVHLSDKRTKVPLCGAEGTHRVMWWSQMTSVCIACRATSDFRLLHSGVAASRWPPMNNRA